MSREEDDEHMHELRQRPPDQLWFYSEDGVLYAVTERIADAMKPGRLIGPYVYDAGDGTPGPAREAAPDEEGAPSPAEAGRWEVACEAGLYAYTVSNGLRTYRTEYLGDAERLATWLNAASGDSGGPPEAGPSDEMEKLKAQLVIVENGYREAAHYILHYGRADHTDWKARAQRILDTTPGGCTPWLSELLALRAELARAPNGWEEAAKVCEEAQAEMKGTRWSGAAACIRALRARADAERRLERFANDMREAGAITWDTYAELMGAIMTLLRAAAVAPAGGSEPDLDALRMQQLTVIDCADHLGMAAIDGRLDLIPEFSKMFRESVTVLLDLSRAAASVGPRPTSEEGTNG